MVCLSADQFVENLLENNEVDVKRSELEGRSGILTWKWILEYLDQLWNHVETRECRQLRHRWKCFTVPPPAPPPEEHVPEMRVHTNSGGDVATKNGDDDLRPILLGSCENEGDWQSRP